MTVATSAPPRFRSVPLHTSSLGRDVVDLADAAGLTLDDWQAEILEAAMGTDAAGRWAAMEVALVVPRQNGKGGLLEALELGHLFLVPTTELITHTAHRFDTCLDHFRRIRRLIEDTPELLALVKDNGRGVGDAPSGIKDSNGKESIELAPLHPGANGRRLLFKAREKGSGRGFSGDLVVLDEAFWLKDLSGLIPTMAARANPQAWYTSSAPLPRIESDPLRALVRQGRALAAGEVVPEPGEPRLAYFEWSTDDVDDADLCTPEVVAASNPAFGIRIDLTFARMELQRLGAEAYRRERLGVFPDDEEAPAWEVWSEATWRACSTAETAAESKVPGWLEGAVTLAVEMPPDRTSATIAAAGASREGGLGAEVVAQNPGTDWLVNKVVSLTSDPKRPVARVVIDARSPAEPFIATLESAGVTVTPCTYADFTSATAAFYDDVVAGRIVHRNRPELDDAVAHATKRTVGDRWLLDRRTGVDISPITAAVLARWGHLLDPEPPKAAGFAMILGGS